MNIAKVIGTAALLGKLAGACEKLERSALQLQVILTRVPMRPEDLQDAKQAFLECCTDVGLCLRELDRAGITAFDIGTAEKRLAKWQEQIREEKANA